MTSHSRHFLAIVILFMSAKLAYAAPTNLGIFSNQRDIGSVAKPGSADFNPATSEYLIAGGGENMWFTNDAFHFVGKKMSGDFTLTADVKFIGTGGNPHRKACLLVRQSLKPGSVYADVAFHGSGLTALQYRDTPDGTTHEIQSNISAPVRMRIEKRGDYISMWLAAAGEDLKPAGGYLRIPLKGEFYVGLGVCAHDNKTIEKAVFSNVELTPVSTPANAQPVLESTLETVAVASTDRSVVYRARDHIEAPNWSRDGKFFLFNGNGRIYKLPVTGGTPEPWTPAARFIATMTTASRPTERNWPSATKPRTASRAFTFCRFPAARRGWSRRWRRRIGTVGRLTAKRSRIARSGTAGLAFPRFPLTAAGKPA